MAAERARLDSGALLVQGLCPVPDATPSSAPAPAPRAQSAGRGLLLITAAKVWFMVGASLLGFLLPHLLPSKVSYGEWGLILAVVSPVNNVIVTATIQAVSKFVSRGAEWVEGAKRAALRMQLVGGGGIALAYFLAAPLVMRAEHAEALTPVMRLSTGVVACYALYALFVGAANGTREFHKQAGLDATFTTLRTVLVLGAAAALHTVAAAVGGFVTAAATVLVISVAVVGLRPAAGRTSALEMARFALPVALYLLVLNLLMFVDLLVVQRLVAESALAVGATAHAAEEAAARQTAVYTAAQQVARIPYQAILSVTFVVFPLVSQATFASDAARTRGYVEKSIRLSLLVVLALAAGVAARPEGLLSLFPKQEYLPGALALSILVFGYVAFSIFSIAGTIINGAGRTRPTTVIGLVTLAADAGICWAAVRFALQTGRDPLAAAAIGTAVATGLGALLSLGYLQRSFGASLRAITLARAAAAVGAAILVGRLLPLPGRAGLLTCVAGGLAYLATLAATREVTVAELRSLLRRG
jgi:stage V sporulation protein B